MSLNKNSTEHLSKKTAQWQKYSQFCLKKQLYQEEKKKHKKDQGSGLKEKIQQSAGWDFKVTMLTNINSLIREI